jgi:hypothetical protein
MSCPHTLDRHSREKRESKCIKDLWIPALRFATVWMTILTSVEEFFRTLLMRSGGVVMGGL